MKNCIEAIFKKIFKLVNEEKRKNIYIHLRKMIHTTIVRGFCLKVYCKRILIL